jgi:hypothetical protein
LLARACIFKAAGITVTLVTLDGHDRFSWDDRREVEGRPSPSGPSENLSSK